MKTLTLKSDQATVEIAPYLGSEIRSFKSITGEEIFWHSPWADRALERCNCNLNDEKHFVSHYHGGMQLMFPNAGYPSNFDSHNYGYHGEVWQKNWKVKSSSESNVITETHLTSPNIILEREVNIEKLTLKVTDKITNLENNSFIFQFGHHPAFSSKFIDEECYVEIKAKTIEIIRNTLDNEPFVLQQDTSTIQFKDIFSKSYSFLAFVSDFVSPFVEIKDKAGSVLATISLDTANLPYAWVWIESRFNDAEPWNSLVETFAFEPCTSKTNQGLAHAVSEGLGHLELLANQSLTTSFEIEISAKGAK